MGTNQSTQNFGQPIVYSNTQQFTNLLPNAHVKPETEEIGEVPIQRADFEDPPPSSSSSPPSFQTNRNWNETVNPLPEENIPTQVNNNPSTFSTATNSSDGYKWRKYGQKTVKGKPHPRSYYKCTFPGCSVKKYVESSGIGSKQNVQYKGTPHTHDPSRITKLNAFDQLSFKNSVVAESLAEHNDSETESETEEKHHGNTTNGLIAGQASHNNGQRLVIETTAVLSYSQIYNMKDVDHLDDGYNWRKYGQKAVKGTSYLRAYYRCTEENCPVKKQVERRDNVIINTYDGTHNHLAPGFEETLSKGKRNKRKIASIEVPQVGECRASRKRTQLTTETPPRVTENQQIPVLPDFLQ